MRDLISRRLKQLSSVPQHTRPAVVACADRASKGDDHLFSLWKPGHELSAYRFEGCAFHVSCRHIDTFGFNAKDLVGVFLIAEDDVTVLHEAFHHLPGLLTPLPKLSPVIEVGRDRNPFLRGHFAGLKAYLRGALRWVWSLPSL